MNLEKAMVVLKDKGWLDNRELAVKVKVKQVRKINPDNPDRPLSYAFQAEAYLTISGDKVYMIQHGMLGKPQKVLLEGTIGDMVAFDVDKGPMGLSKSVQVANHEARYQMIVMKKYGDMLEKMQAVAMKP
jgi:hypothetical protein